MLQNVFRLLLACLSDTVTRCNNFFFINLFNSALYVSGDKFAHPQEHFLIVYTAFGTMHRHCCRSAAVSVHCTKRCIYNQKVLLGMGEFVAQNIQGLIKKINKRKSCCILLVVIYIVILPCISG